MSHFSRTGSGTQYTTSLYSRDAIVDQCRSAEGDAATNTAGEDVRRHVSQGNVPAPTLHPLTHTRNPRIGGKLGPNSKLANTLVRTGGDRDTIVGRISAAQHGATPSRCMGNTPPVPKDIEEMMFLTLWGPAAII